jgi:hypothetical protein
MTTTEGQTAPPGSYQVKVNEPCLVTFKVVPLADRAMGLSFALYGPADVEMILLPASAAVRVEPLPKPALPTAFGSRISASVGRLGEAFELVLARPAGLRPWVSPEGRSFADADLSDVEVLHAPDASLAAPESAVPVGLVPGHVECFECETSGRNCPAHPSTPDPEPVELPTGLGAVVRATWGLQRIVAVLAKPNDKFGWACAGRSNGKPTGWLTSEDFEDVTVLHPGIEVELP